MSKRQIRLVLEAERYLNLVLSWCHDTQYYDERAEEILAQVLDEIILNGKAYEDDVLYDRIEDVLHRELLTYGLAIQYVESYQFKRGTLVLIMKKGIEQGSSYRIPYKE